MWQRAGVSDYDIRPVDIDERRAVINTFRVAVLSGPVNDATFEAGTESWNESDALAWDGDRCVGSVSAFHFDSTIPGGARVQTAGVARVGVLPTHTRRGLLTQMMHRLLVESRGPAQRAGNAARQRDVDLPAVRIRSRHGRHRAP